MTEDSGSPLAAGGEQIRQREFATVRRGYDPTQVRAYLTLVATRVDALERSLAEVRARAQELEAASPAAVGDAYEQLSKRFAGVLVSADSEASHIVEQARTQAEHIRAEAQARAEESRIRGSQSVIAAQEESDRMLASLAQRRAAMLAQLHEMQSRLLSVAEDLEVAIQPSDRGEAQAPPFHRPQEPVEDPWGEDEPPLAPSDDGLSGLFGDLASDQGDPAELPPDEGYPADLPDLSGIDLDLDDDRDRGR